LTKSPTPLPSPLAASIALPPPTAPVPIVETAGYLAQILALAGKGLSNSEIAEHLHLSTHTIKSHIHNALGKLGASNRAQGASLVLAHVGETRS